MTKAEGDKDPRFAQVTILGEVHVKDVVLGAAIAGATDPEMMEEAIESLHDRYGVEVIDIKEVPNAQRDRLIPSGGTTIIFSAEAWRAPWQPKGPTPNWRGKEPIQ